MIEQGQILLPRFQRHEAWRNNHNTLTGRARFKIANPDVLKAHLESKRPPNHTSAGAHAP